MNVSQRKLKTQHWIFFLRRFLRKSVLSNSHIQRAALKWPKIQRAAAFQGSE